MFRKVIPLVVVLLIPILCPGQGSREKSALKDISKHRWNRAYATLKKTILKDTLNPPALYVLGRYFFESQNPDFQLDSAYRYARRAIGQWSIGSAKNRQRWSRLPLDSAMLLRFREQVEAAAFEFAKKQNREESLIYFLKAYPLAKERPAAIELRNQLAFNKAKEENTYMGFLEFIEKYPDAKEIPEATKQYDQLLFNFFTKDQRLSSFEDFLATYPDTPFKDEAEKNIFQLSTISGVKEDFISFLDRHPNSRYSRFAANILYHLLGDDSLASFPKAFENDSIQQQRQAADQYIAPFLSKGKFGFMNPDGTEAIAPMYREIPDEYVCGSITEDILVLDKKLVNRSGQLIRKEEILEIEDLGNGYVKAGLTQGSILIHKSGFRIGDFLIDEVKSLHGRMFALRVKDRWGIFALNGRRVLSINYSNISNFGDVIVLEKDGKMVLTTIPQLIRMVKGDEITFSEPFDEVKKLGENILVRIDSLEGVLDQNLRVLIKMDHHKITPTSFGAVGFSSRGFVTFNRFGEESEYFEKLEVKDPWVVAKTRGGWVLYDPQQRMEKSILYDTISIYGPFAVGKKPEGLEINIFGAKPGNTLSLLKADRIEFLPGKDSVSFLLIENDKKSSVYNTDGVKLLTISADKIQYAGNGFFTISRKEKKGLINFSGKTILPVEYDAIGTESKGSISLLRGMKFGSYDANTRKLIKPAYDKNLVRIGDAVYSAFRDGSYGLVNSDNKPLTKFEFSEIQPWKDSVVLVKQNGTLGLFNFIKKEYELSNIKEVKPIRDSERDKLYIFQLKDASGVIDNRKGVIIPLTFSDIVNVGSPENPLYFTEKHVEEASLFVVIYYDSAGKMLRREVYENEDYDRIFCDQ